MRYKTLKNKTQIYLIIILSLFLLVGIGYAALSATLKINGQTTINKASWDIHMEDINVTSGSVTATTVPTLDTAKTTVSFSITLTNPGDFYEFTVKEVNKGTIDAMVSTISKTGLTTTQAKYLDYTVTYDSGLTLAKNQILKSGKSEYLRVKVAFKKDVTAADLPTVDTTLNLNLSLSYQQAESNAVAIVHPTCKRATVLHTEVCNQTSTSQYCSGSGYEKGDVITYGNLGTNGVLTSGDAFDCDVNGDGVYNSKTERFYYVSGKDGDNSSDYATLIYYSNVSEGIPDNTKTYAWSSKDDYMEAGGTESNYGSKGPITAIKQLPTTTQWKNVKLSNSTRNITDEKDNIKANDFSYAGYAARMLTYKEAYIGCYDGKIYIDSLGGLEKKCKYIMENTKFSNNSNGTHGSWLESPYLDNNHIHRILVTARGISGHVSTDIYNSGVRPAIEVEKSKINY